MILTNNEKNIAIKKTNFEQFKSTVVIILCILTFLLVENRPDTNLNKLWIIQLLPYVVGKNARSTASTNFFLYKTPIFRFYK